MKLSIKFAFVLMAGSIMTGCASNNADVGTLLGGASGAIIGNQVGGGSGRVAATALGAVAGAWVGNRVGARLDDRDRRDLHEYSKRSAETGEPYSFYNPDTGVRGRTEVVSHETLGRRECRVVRQRVSVRNERETYEDIRTCRNENGWEVR
ncbi:MAG: glycine zipper 2TM domain-containing protein [Pseudomonadota bacterium]